MWQETGVTHDLQEDPFSCHGSIWPLLQMGLGVIGKQGTGKEGCMLHPACELVAQ